MRTIAGALAAVASAVLLSTLGAAGTILGAAVGSVVVTIASAYFSEGLATSRRTLAKANVSAQRKVGIAEAEVHRAARVEDTAARESHLDHAEERLAQANRELDDAAVAAPGWRARLEGLPWRRIAWVSAALFLVTILVITLVELFVGKPVSSITGGTDGGGTTIGDVRDGGSGGRQRQPDKDDPVGPGGSPSPTGSPTPATPSESTPTPTTPPPTVTDTWSPSGTVSPEPAQSASP